MPRWIEETFHPHWRVRLEASSVLHEMKTAHQHLVIFTNETWGTVLMLDGVCQLTTSDEFIYHEMMAHVPLMALARPRRVLVVGGGDGGVLREVLKHPSVQKATLCEIDRAVIDLSLKYYPEIAGNAFDDPRADIVIADGLKYVAETKERFDAIIVDSSEPIGPSAVLHTPEFFADCKRALKGGGILVTQNGLPFLFPDHLQATTAIFASLFKRAAPYLCTQPCYFGGPFALNLATDDKGVLKLDAKDLEKRRRKREVTDLRYWTPEAHIAAFALPAYARKVADEAIAEGRGKGHTAKAHARLTGAGGKSKRKGRQA
ncbi:MAG TPA: polyamine aminopropyltransferase [Hyphomicrobiaceae bacterium]|nr:polyamine aminopropyltransferase [Hyphomicrobiaceae bacterium]